MLFVYAAFQNLRTTDLNAAFAVLDTATRVGDAGLIYLRDDPLIDPVRRDPRFDGLLSRLKFE